MIHGIKMMYHLVSSLYHMCIGKCHVIHTGTLLIHVSPSRICITDDTGVDAHLIHCWYSVLWFSDNTMLVHAWSAVIHVLRSHISTVSISRDNTTCIGRDTCITALRLGGFDIPSCHGLIRTWYILDTTLDTCINYPPLRERNDQPGAIVIRR